jgi:SHS2 domain-containing protein
VAASGSVAFSLDPAGDEELLLPLLEEVIYLVDVHGVVPTDVHVEAAADGGLFGRFDVASLAPGMVIGPAPKAVAWHGLSLVAEGDAWRCRVTIDV